MVQPGRHPDLAQEASRARGDGELGVEDLKRHRPVMPEVPGEEHRGHAATPKLALNRVAVGETRLKLFAKVGHVQPRRSGGPPMLRRTSTG